MVFEPNATAFGSDDLWSEKALLGSTALARPRDPNELPLTRKELAARERCKPSTISARVERGWLPPGKPNGNGDEWYASEVDAHKAANPQPKRELRGAAKTNAEYKAAGIERKRVIEYVVDADGQVVLDAKGRPVIKHMRFDIQRVRITPEAMQRIRGVRQKKNPQKTE